MQNGAHEVEAITRPSEEFLRGSKLLMGSITHRRGWWMHQNNTQRLYVELDNGRWLKVEDCTERQSFELLDMLQVR